MPKTPPTTPNPKIAQIKSNQHYNNKSISGLYETLDIPISESALPQEQKQTVVNYPTKISSTIQRVQSLESDVRIKKEQLNRDNGFYKEA